MRDGAAGHVAESRFGSHLRACNRVGVVPDRRVWQQGYARGLENYCTPSSGPHEGQAGRPYRNVCPAATEAGFRSGHELVRAEYERRTRVRDLSREIDHRTRRIAALRKALQAPDADTALREGLRENEAEAVRWYRRAAEAGEKTAMMMLGWHYQNDRSASQASAQAIRWYRRAAGLGNAQSALRLARLRAQGHGGAAGRAEATRWYRVAAEAGAPAAMAELGFRLGRAAEPDPDSAADWLLRAQQMMTGYHRSFLTILTGCPRPRCARSSIGCQKPGNMTARLTGRPHRPYGWRSHVPRNRRARGRKNRHTDIAR